ncbi:unnamed protein product, partial [marine sediment metagenome]
EFKSYVLTKEPNIDLAALKNKYESWVENGWKDGKNNKIINWKSKILNTLIYLPKDTSKQKFDSKHPNRAWK